MSASRLALVSPAIGATRHVGGGSFAGGSASSRYSTTGLVAWWHISSTSTSQTMATTRNTRGSRGCGRQRSRARHMSGHGQPRRLFTRRASPVPRRYLPDRDERAIARSRATCGGDEPNGARPRRARGGSCNRQFLRDGRGTQPQLAPAEHLDDVAHEVELVRDLPTRRGLSRVVLDLDLRSLAQERHLSPGPGVTRIHSPIGHGSPRAPAGTQSRTSAPCRPARQCSTPPRQHVALRSARGWVRHALDHERLHPRQDEPELLVRSRLCRGGKRPARTRWCLSIEPAPNNGRPTTPSASANEWDASQSMHREDGSKAHDHPLVGMAGPEVDRRPIATRCARGDMVRAVVAIAPELLRTQAAFVDGRWIEADDGAKLLAGVVNPATGDTIADVPRLGAVTRRGARARRQRGAAGVACPELRAPGTRAPAAATARGERRTSSLR